MEYFPYNLFVKLFISRSFQGSFIRLMIFLLFGSWVCRYFYWDGLKIGERFVGDVGSDKSIIDIKEKNLTEREDFRFELKVQLWIFFTLQNRIEALF